MLKNVKKTSFGLHIVGCGLGGVKMDQSGIRVGQSGSEWVRVDQSGSEWVRVGQSGSEWIRVGQSGSEHGLVLPKKEYIITTTMLSQYRIAVIQTMDDQYEYDFDSEKTNVKT